MKNSKKRGFTIVELVIVIAVIAILAGVLIPTFVSVIKKGQEANDTALIKYLNTSLTAGTIGGKAPETMQGALDIVEADGYNVAKIKATASGARILWDSKNNCFVYLKDGENEPTYIPDSKTQNVANVDYWQITEADEDLSGKYSNYLALGYTKDLSNVQTGLDVGQNDNIAAITYKGAGTAQKVVINMNGGTLTVDAVTDDVYRYGTADKVIITAVAPTSYHECGEVIGNIEVAKGHVFVEASAKVESVIATTAEVEVDVQNQSTEVKAASGVDLTGKVNGATAKSFTYVSTVDELQNANGEVVLNADIRGSVSFSNGSNIVLDANGHKIFGKITVMGGTSLTIKGNGYFNSKDHTIQIDDGSLTVDSGTFIAGDCCIANLPAPNVTKPVITINGGTFTSLDNGVLMSNGNINLYQGAKWIINGGTFNGNIKSKGYIALGLCASNTDEVTINAGVFNIKNGVGIVCRSGKTTIGKDVIINITNDGTITSGLVGDSRIEISVSSYIVKDTKSKYPAGAPQIVNNSAYSIIEIVDGVEQK